MLPLRRVSRSGCAGLDKGKIVVADRVDAASVRKGRRHIFATWQVQQVAEDSANPRVFALPFRHSRPNGHRKDHFCASQKTGVDGGWSAVTRASGGGRFGAGHDLLDGDVDVGLLIGCQPDPRRLQHQHRLVRAQPLKRFG